MTMTNDGCVRKLAVVLKDTEILMHEIEEERTETIYNLRYDVEEEAVARYYKKLLAPVYRMRNNAAALLLRRGCTCSLDDGYLRIRLDGQDCVFPTGAIRLVLQQDFDRVIAENRRDVPENLSTGAETAEAEEAAPQNTENKEEDPEPERETEEKQEPEDTGFDLEEETRKAEESPAAENGKPDGKEKEISPNGQATMRGQTQAQRGPEPPVGRQEPQTGSGQDSRKTAQRDGQLYGRPGQQAQSGLTGSAVRGQNRLQDPAGRPADGGKQTQKADGSRFERERAGQTQSRPADMARQIPGAGNKEAGAGQPFYLNDPFLGMADMEQDFAPAPAHPNKPDNAQPVKRDGAAKKDGFWSSSGGGAETDFDSLFDTPLFGKQEEKPQKQAETERGTSRFRQGPAGFRADSRQEKRGEQAAREAKGKEEQAQERNAEKGQSTGRFKFNRDTFDTKADSGASRKVRSQMPETKPKFVTSSTSDDPDEMLEQLKKDRAEYDRAQLELEIENSEKAAADLKGDVFDFSTGSFKSGKVDVAEATGKIDRVADSVVGASKKDSLLAMRMSVYGMQTESDFKRRKKDFIFDVYRLLIRVEDRGQVKEDTVSLFVAPIAIPESGSSITTDICAYLECNGVGQSAVVSPGRNADLSLSCDDYAIFLKGYWDSGNFVSNYAVKGTASKAECRELNKARVRPASMEGVGIGHNVIMLDYATVVHVIPLSSRNSPYGNVKFMAVVVKDYEIDRDAKSYVSEEDGGIEVRGERQKRRLFCSWSEEDELCVQSTVVS